MKRLEVAKTTIGGIILPDSAQSKINEGKVVAVGTGKRNMQGETMPISLKVGDKVLLSESFNGTDITLGDEDFTIYREEDILAKIEDD